VSSEALRIEIVETGRALLRSGLVAGTSGNVSARDGEHFVITPTSLPYDEIEPGDLVTLTLAGEVVAGRREPSSERRVHQAIYAARPDIQAIVHSHSVHATAWSFLGEPIDLDTEELVHAAGGAVRCAGHGASGSDALAQEAVAALTDRRAVLLARHGVVAVAASPMQALDACAVVERQAEVAWLLRRAGALPPRASDRGATSGGASGRGSASAPERGSGWTSDAASSRDATSSPAADPERESGSTPASDSA
jgi:L-fuculose-phosphate aldolase